MEIDLSFTLLERVLRTYEKIVKINWNFGMNERELETEDKVSMYAPAKHCRHLVNVTLFPEFIYKLLFGFSSFEKIKVRKKQSMRYANLVMFMCDGMVYERLTYTKSRL